MNKRIKKKLFVKSAESSMPYNNLPIEEVIEADGEFFALSTGFWHNSNILKLTKGSKKHPELVFIRAASKTGGTDHYFKNDDGSFMERKEIVDLLSNNKIENRTFVGHTFDKCVNIGLIVREGDGYRVRCGNLTH